MLVKSSIFAISNKRKNIDIMKKILYFAATLMMFAAVSCSKDETTPNNTTTNNNGGGNTPAPTSTIAKATIGNGTFGAFENVPGIDFDGDGLLEYRIMDDEFSGSTLRFDEYNAEHGTNVVTEAEAGVGGQYLQDHIVNIAANAVIGPNMAPNGYYAYGDAYFFEPTVGTWYVGLRVKLADGIHYGWAKVNMTMQDEFYNANWVEVYYNKKVGETIKAGQKE